jgi:hypothetical protein
MTYLLSKLGQGHTEKIFESKIGLYHVLKFCDICSSHFLSRGKNVFLYLLTRDLLNLEIRSRSPWLLLPSPVVLVPSLVDMGPGSWAASGNVWTDAHTHACMYSANYYIPLKLGISARCGIKIGPTFLHFNQTTSYVILIKLLSNWNYWITFQTAWIYNDMLSWLCKISFS